MNESTGRDTAAMALAGLALVMGLVQLIFLPFVFGPAALIALIVAVMLSGKHRGLYGAATLVITIGFIVGASIAAGGDRSLY